MNNNGTFSPLADSADLQRIVIGSLAMGVQAVQIRTDGSLVELRVL